MQQNYFLFFTYITILKKHPYYFSRPEMWGLFVNSKPAMLPTQLSHTTTGDLKQACVQLGAFDEGKCSGISDVWLSSCGEPTTWH